MLSTRPYLPTYEQAKEDAEDLKAERAALEADIAELIIKANEAEIILHKSAQSIGNIVHDSVPISDTEVCMYYERFDDDEIDKKNESCCAK